jgi:two-component system nitrogen regulation sensor histidine kinase NtrY
MAFVNIINNAIDAVDGQGNLEISSRFDKEKMQVVVDFTDDGPGIPLETRDKLFLPYFSTKKKGTGLGLAIVSRIISDHRGTIAVSDNQPHGARFTITLPSVS